MKNKIINVKERLEGRIVEKLGGIAESIGGQTKGRCFIVGAYEPKIPIEFLKEQIENNR